ncbi:hypothetical protein RND71_016886 [Anisodus tanguticus]|uniref:alpha,alpha-trehalase n=1 Tax=Anisodus tanguticus TaxID=243964 RepID=A0AAE1VD87_9SOLA|nr:hypothetical protein RND71_016886 [Anisodus tanguticus]
MSLRHDLSETVEAFKKLSRTVNGSISVNDLDGFIGKYLGVADEDLVYVEPVDYVAEPEGFFAKVVFHMFSQPPVLAGMIVDIYNRTGDLDLVRRSLPALLKESGLEEARALAKDIAVRWIRTNYVAYKKTGAMYEKYDVTKCGAVGGGGVYVAQTGFGWANGVVLALLEEFGWPEDLKIDCY